MSGLFIAVQHVVPQHLLSRLVGRFARSKIGWLKNLLITRFVARYHVDMTEAANRDPTSYACFNEFFTRELRAGVRPMIQGDQYLACPADGAVSQLGPISGDRVFQAKGHDYSLATLLADANAARQFENGLFATIYLSPKDYHRLHMPCDGVLKKALYVPGDLFSVNTATAENVANLFARNERLVCFFDTPFGPMSMTLVGAMIVAGIETVWGGQAAPSRAKVVSDITPAHTVKLNKGDEMGRFMLGSTVILTFAPNAVSLNGDLAALSPVRMGEKIATAISA